MIAQTRQDWREQLAPEWQIHDFLKRYRRVAVVGMPADLGRDEVVEAERLLGYDFQFFPVHSDCGRALGHDCVPHLHDVQGAVDIVLVLPGSADHLVHLAKEVIRKRPKVFWMQDHPIDRDVAELLMQEGILVVAERNLEKEFFASNP